MIRVLTCVHAGKYLQREELCGPCGGKVSLKVYACALLGETNEATCKLCREYAPKAPRKE